MASFSLAPHSLCVGVMVMAIFSSSCCGSGSGSGSAPSQVIAVGAFNIQVRRGRAFAWFAVGACVSCALSLSLSVCLSSRSMLDAHTFNYANLISRDHCDATPRVQVFGRSKMRKEGVPEKLARIIRAFDLLLVQEIRDSSMETPGQLLAVVNENLPATQRFAMVLSDRFGSTSSKEAYAYFYRSSLMAPAAHGKAAGAFPERPPFVAEWALWTGLRFVTIGMHVDPDAVVAELDELGKVAIKHVEAGQNVVALGDFNAACAYLSKSKWACIRDPTCTTTSMRLWDGEHFGARNWLIGDEVDTSVAAASCAYDRIVVSSSLLPRVAPSTLPPHKVGSLPCALPPSPSPSPNHHHHTPPRARGPLPVTHW